MSIPNLSIIIPTYNSASTLSTAIESILNQTYEDFEILIIDGLSEDDTLEICKFFNDARIKIISEKDKGIYDAMNKGINLAKGEWLYFLGSDDSLFDNEVLEDINNFISSSDSLIVYGNVKIVGNAGWAADGVIYDGEFSLNKILRKNISHQSIFYSKNVFKTKSYNLRYKVCADYDLNLNLFSKHNFKYFNRTIANFSGGGYSIVASDENFILNDAIIKYFFYSLWRKDFYFLKIDIRLYSLTNVSVFKYIYLQITYYKHRLIKK